MMKCVMRTSAMYLNRNLSSKLAFPCREVAMLSRCLSTDNNGGKNSGDVSEDRQLQHLNVETISSRVKRVLEENSHRNVYVGHGQYFQHATDERFIIMNSLMPLYGASEEDNVSVETIMDVAVDSSQSKRLIDVLSRYSDSPVGSGELDFINRGKWSCGFSYSPAFSIFSKETKLLSLFVNDVDKKAYLRIYAYGFYDDFSVDEVEAIRVRISDEPWCEQGLDIVFNNEEVITILEKEFRATSDLSLLMVETEWLVKCAGLLCLDIKKKCSKAVRLQLPQNLTVAGNPWVEMRHQAWVKSLSSAEESV